MNYSNSPLLTDLYQLTMMQAYFDNNIQQEAVFEFFVRKFPKGRDFLVACGLQQVLDYLENFRFTEDELSFLREDGRFTDAFINSLADMRFNGSIHGMPEGTLFFPDEPIIRVTAPLPVAQLVETRIINILQFQTMIASKAVLMKQIMNDKLLIDYGLRRAHGAEAGVMAARASYIAGFDGTATVLAGKLYDIPLYGTMAHSFIQAHDSETAAFINFATSHPNNTVILLDTYDTEKAANKVVELAPKLKEKNIVIRGVRLDSGDMIGLSKKVRHILDQGGLKDTLIIASGSLDEKTLQDFRDQNAPVDGFGIGSKMTTSADAPYLDCAYKLVEYDGKGKRKLSKAKATWPGRKQVFRKTTPEGIMCGDWLALEHEVKDGTPLIKQYMADGIRTQKLPSLAETRNYLQKQLQTMPQTLDTPKGYQVAPTPALRAFADEVIIREVTKD